MQKARGRPATKTTWDSPDLRSRTSVVLVAGLPLLVDTGFQELFHSSVRGAFHLSLTVLVHYRSPGNI